jgi:agmatinase
MIEPYPRVTSGASLGPVDATVVPRYAGPATFARLPRLDEVDRADVAVLGVPFEAAHVGYELLSALAVKATREAGL